MVDIEYLRCLDLYCLDLDPTDKIFHLYLIYYNEIVGFTVPGEVLKMVIKSKL